MDCIYLILDECRAQPFTVGPAGGGLYKPNEEDKKDYCQAPSEFQSCPRFVAFMAHLEVAGLRKE